jgi:hypothetical protein
VFVYKIKRRLKISDPHSLSHIHSCGPESGSSFLGIGEWDPAFRMTLDPDPDKMIKIFVFKDNMSLKTNILIILSGSEKRYISKIMSHFYNSGFMITY